MADNEIWTYVAGLFDGEGCIRRTFNKKHGVYMLHSEIQKYRDVLADIVKALKGGDVLSQTT